MKFQTPSLKAKAAAAAKAKPEEEEVKELDDMTGEPEMIVNPRKRPRLMETASICLAELLENKLTKQKEELDVASKEHEASSLSSLRDKLTAEKTNEMTWL